MADTSWRGTIRRRVELPPAPGAISRRAVTVALEPVEIGSGLSVRRADIGREWPLDLAHVVAMPNCTAIGEDEGSVAFVEHVMAALRAALISDVLVVTDGPEIPLYDGSARVIWAALQEVGRVESRVAWEPLRIRKPLEVGEGEAAISGRPSATPRFSYDLKHHHPLIGRQSASYGAGDDFAQELAGARTFATAEELRALYGMEPTPEMEALCVVVYPDRVSDPALPADGFARHKLVDLLGDLYLCGRVVVGEVAAQRSGHNLNRAFLRALLAEDPTRES